MGIYMKAYNFTPDEKTKKPAGSVLFEISKSGNGENVLVFSEMSLRSRTPQPSK
jgi:hypothetical protein